jgi:hypothetical protein
MARLKDKDPTFWKPLINLTSKKTVLAGQMVNPWPMIALEDAHTDLLMMDWLEALKDPAKVTRTHSEQEEDLRLAFDTWNESKSFIFSSWFKYCRKKLPRAAHGSKTATQKAAVVTASTTARTAAKPLDYSSLRPLDETNKTWWSSWLWADCELKELTELNAYQL